MRLIRRLQVGATVAAVVAVTGTAAVMLPPSPKTNRENMAAPPNAPNAPATPAPARKQTRTQPGRATIQVPPGHEPTSPDLLLDRLLARLPADLTQSDYAGDDIGQRDENDVYSAGTYVSLRLENSRGGTTLLTLTLGLDPQTPQDVRCPPLEGTEAECTDVVLADGVRLVQERNWVYPASPNTEDGKAGPSGRGPSDWRAYAVRPDGLVVLVDAIATSDAANPDEEGSTRRAPLLSMEQLAGIATFDWQLWVTPEMNREAPSLISEPPTATTPPPSSPDPGRSTHTPTAAN